MDLGMHQRLRRIELSRLDADRSTARDVAAHFEKPTALINEVVLKLFFIFPESLSMFAMNPAMSLELADIAWGLRYEEEL